MKAKRKRPTTARMRVLGKKIKAMDKSFMAERERKAKAYLRRRSILMLKLRRGR